MQAAPVESGRGPLPSLPSCGNVAAMGEAGRTTAERSAARVLVGEPYPEVRAFLERALARLGHEPIAPDGRWRAGSLPEVDVLILEPALPDGVELARALRRAKPGLPVICTASGPFPRDVEQLEPVACLVKPFAVAELARALRGAVARARSCA